MSKSLTSEPTLSNTTKTEKKKIPCKPEVNSLKELESNTEL